MKAFRAIKSKRPVFIDASSNPKDLDCPLHQGKKPDAYPDAARLLGSVSQTSQTNVLVAIILISIGCLEEVEV